MGTCARGRCPISHLFCLCAPGWTAPGARSVAQPSRQRV